MSLDTQRKGQIGVNAVERVVLNDWNSRWQPIDSFNDDGVDGLIFIESGGHTTGQIVFAQVKYRKDLKTDKKKRLAITISAKRLKSNIETWRKVVGAMILISVDPDGKTMHWADLHSVDTTKGTRIYVPTKNKFDAEALEPISRLCGTLHRDVLLKQISTTTEDFSYLKEKGSLHQVARQYYRGLSSKKLAFDGARTEIRFTREGWQHMTRLDRPRLVQLQSFLLLGALAPMIRGHSERNLTIVKRKITSKKDQKKANAGTREKEYAILRAAVSFPFRQTAVVAVVFRRRTAIAKKTSYSFYTVYEPRRKRDMIGKRRE